MSDIQLVRSYDSQIPSKVLYIDSRDATQYLHTDLSSNKTYTSYFLYNLEEKIEVPENQVIFVSLNSATIPYSFYNIRTDVNDKILAVIHDTSNPGVLKDATYTIPAGNYSALSLADNIVDNFLQSDDGVFNFKLTIDFDSDTGKYTFSLVGTGGDSGKTFSMNIGFDSTCAVELGIRFGQNLIFTNTPNTSSNFVDVNGSIHGLYIRTNLTSNTTMDSNNGTFSNILERIPIKVQPGGILFREPKNSGHKALTYSKNISQIQIRLTDDRNRLLDLNGLHFQIAVQFDFDYLQNIIPPLNAEQRRLIGYGVDGSIGASIKAQADLKVSERKQQEQQKKKKLGRPRKVGRPKGT